jgi:aspartyl-tRNA(Asn)/glutamyl-tRNA(Gln) amidotransferase subunit A
MMAGGTLTALDLAHATFAAIAECEDSSVFTLTTYARACAEAEAAASRFKEGFSLGPLDGIPVAWKDLYDFKGEVTRAGSIVLDDGPAIADAELVQRLAAAGAVTVGKLNMSEFAFSGLGLNPHYGTPRNPWSKGEARIPGGSSSGCGVAVARGIVPVAIGTDTSGSVRIPAALNGVIGFKTSRNRWPLAGAYPLSRTLDTAGVFAHTAVDAAVVDAIARGQAKEELRVCPIKGIRIVVPSNVVWDDVEAAVASNFEAALERLQSHGVVVEHRQIKVLDDVLSLSSAHGTLVAVEAYQLHRHLLSSSASLLMDRRVRARLEAGGTIASSSEASIRNAQVTLMDAMTQLFDGNTFLAYPTVPKVAPLLAPLMVDDDLFVRTNSLMLRNTLIGSFLGWCGISIPTGADESGLPTALLLSGAPGGDQELLTAAISMESIIRNGFSTVRTSPTT